jgi:SAM-dependent methyltransferase
MKMKKKMNIETIYNNIAEEFDRTRTSLWNCVIKFLDTFPSDSKILDVGCGNGKYMNYRSDIQMKGIDISIKLVDICKNKGFDVKNASMTSIPYDNDIFDGVIVIASYHHLDNNEDRKKTLDEIYRILKIDGIAFIEVWSNNDNNDKNYKRWKSVKTGIIYYRYYNFYKEGELENEIRLLKPEFKIIGGGYEKGNYYIKIQK